MKVNSSEICEDLSSRPYIKCLNVFTWLLFYIFVFYKKQFLITKKNQIISNCLDIEKISKQVLKNLKSFSVKKPIFQPITVEYRLKSVTYFKNSTKRFCLMNKIFFYECTILYILYCDIFENMFIILLT